MSALGIQAELCPAFAPEEDMPGKKYETPNRLPEQEGIVLLWRWLTDHLLSALLVEGLFVAESGGVSCNIDEKFKRERMLLEALHDLRVQYEKDAELGWQDGYRVTRYDVWVTALRHFLWALFRAERRANWSPEKRKEMRLGILDQIYLLTGLRLTEQDRKSLLNKGPTTGPADEAQEVVSSFSFGIGEQALRKTQQWLGERVPIDVLTQDTADYIPPASKRTKLYMFLQLDLGLDDEETECIIQTFDAVHDSSDEHWSVDAMWNAFMARFGEKQ